MAAHCTRRIVSQLLVIATRSVSGSTASEASSTVNFGATKTKRLPLEGIKVVELSGIPAIPTGVAVVPFCGLILADFGADVTVIKKAEGELLEYRLTRGKTLNVLNMQDSKDVKKVRSLCLESDVLLDPYRPGVIERAGLDPLQLLKDNEKLIVARITGFGQTGELSQRFGRELNYVSMSGLMPTFAGHSPARFPYWTPANLLAGFAGGSLMAAFGIVAALMQRSFNGGKGAIIDVSMVEGLAYLGSFQTIYKDIDNVWNKPYSWFSGDCPVYRCYETADGKFMAVAALERKFHSTLLKTLGLNAKVSDIWTKPEEVTKEMEAIFKSKTRREWAKIFRGVDACVTPAVDLQEVGRVRHHQQREAFKMEKNKFIPQPAPRIYTREEYEAILNDIDSKI
ncbi:CaiB/baiF CoA-transferase family protein [Toxocara canis]|nr:CaiB/baiF CoA-transferase family protein [Toxocara canis]